MRRFPFLLPVLAALATAAVADEPPAPADSQTVPPAANQPSLATQPDTFPTLGISAGTRGLDLELGYSFSPYFGARLVGADTDPRYKTSRNGIDYQGHYDFRSLSLLGDWYPWGGGFRITGGAVYDDDRIKAQAEPGNGGIVTVNGGSYALAPGDTVLADGRFPQKYVPYLGIGFGNPAAHHQGVGFSMDLGAIYTQNPTVTLTPTGPDASNPVAQFEVQQEQNKLNSDLHKINVFPVASIGVYYGF